MHKKEITPEAKVTLFLSKFWKPVLGVAALAVVLSAAYFAYSAYAKSVEKKAQEQLFAIQKKLADKKESLLAEEKKSSDKKGAPDKKGAKNPTPQKSVEKTPDLFSKNFGEIVDDYRKFINAQSGHKASYMAAIEIAGLASEYKDYPKAEEVLLSVSHKPAKKDIFFGMLRSQLGSVLMDLGKYKEAKEQFLAVTENKDQEIFHAQALLRLGVCYLLDKEYDLAQKAFVRIEKDHAATGAAMEAANYKKLIALRKGDHAQ